MKFLRGVSSLAAAVFVLLPSVGQAQQFGKFEGDVVATWPVHERRQMELTQDFAYVAPDGVRWRAPKGSKVDGASIPRIFWTVVGPPYVGEYRRASVVHDVACVEKKRSWQSVHRMFYTAMRADGLSESKAKLMYAAVYMGGPRWELRSSPLIAVNSIPAVTDNMIRSVGTSYRVSAVSVSNSAAGTAEALGAEGATRVTLVLESALKEPTRQDVEAIQRQISADASLSLDELERIVDRAQEGK